MIDEIEDEFCRRVAQQRVATHASHSSSRPLSSDYEFVGVKGEYALAVRFGLSLESIKAVRVGGDGHIDFNVAGYSIDVKTARKPYNLLVEVGVPVADLIVLGRYTEGCSVDLVGWEYSQTMLLCPTKDFGYGINNYFLSASNIRPMKTLDVLLRRVVS